MERETTLCFTGHRPEKICTPFDEASPFIDGVKHQLQARILAAVDQGYTTFLCGMARGTDIWAGEIVAGLWESFRNLELVAVLPFPGQADDWARDWAIRHRRLLRMAPLHHHFEMSGVSERKIVLVFALITIAACAVGLLSTTL